MKIDSIINEQNKYFNLGHTLSHSNRISALNSLKEAILFYEEELYIGLNEDLNKGRLESYLTEIHMVLSEIALCKKSLKKWMRLKFLQS